MYIILYILILLEICTKFGTVAQGIGNPLNPFDPILVQKTTTKSKVSTIAEAKYYAYFTAAVYCHNPELGDWTCDACKKTGKDVHLVSVIHNRSYNTRVLVTLNIVRKEIVFAFRGTVSARNLGTDAQLLQLKKSGNIRVHTGAWNAMKSLYKNSTIVLRALITKIPHFNVVITGHSLGGMEGSLFLYALRMSPEFKNLKLSLFTYGQPRVGNLAFANWVNSQPIKVMRVVNGADVAAHVVTPSGLDYTYAHFNTELWITKSGKKAKFCSRTVVEDPKCSNSKGPFYEFSDHLKYWDADYIKCLGKNPFPYLENIF